MAHLTKLPCPDCFERRQLGVYAGKEKSMKKVLVVVLLVVGAFWVWKLTHPLSFTIELRDGRKVQVTSIYYSPLIGWDKYESDKCFSLNNDIGEVDVRKNLEDIQSIQVLNKTGEELKVTYLSGYSVEGTRLSFIDKYISDYIKGKSGKLKVDIPLEKVISITRD